LRSPSRLAVQRRDWTKFLPFCKRIRLTC
jgi:hypothetical protein